MRLVRLIGPALLVLGLAAIVVAFQQGEATLSLLLVIPVITATGGWAFLGILLFVAGLFLSFLGWSWSETPAVAPSTPPAAGMTEAPSLQRRWGGVVFLGPVPIVFGSDPKMAKWMIVAGFVLLIVMVVLTMIAVGVI